MQPMVKQAVREWLSRIGRKGGSVVSPSKAAAARRNGRKGGRPQAASLSLTPLRHSKEKRGL
jgi:hypothetical protein